MKNIRPPSNILQHSPYADLALYFNCLLYMAALHCRIQLSMDSVWQPWTVGGLNPTLLLCHRIWGSKLSLVNRALGHAIRIWKHYPFCSTLEQFFYHFLSVQWNDKQTFSVELQKDFKQAFWSSPEAALSKHCLARHYGMFFCFLKITSSYFYKPFFPLCLRNHFRILYGKIFAKI